MVTQTKSYNRSCPCKNIPWSISSFTAAEYGDIHALLKRQQKTEEGVPIYEKQDAAGNTLLHLTSQHNHVAATNLLLKLGADVNGKGKTSMVEDAESCSSSSSCASTPRRATPLHRAAFSGATATMRLLLQEEDCNILIKDSSFGDLKTPLHKAATGGRYLAVQLLLDESKRRGLLHEALASTDSMGQTALQIAEGIIPIEDKERSNVARWDVIAGGIANWSKCAALLQNAEENLPLATSPSSLASTSKDKTIHMPEIPDNLSTLQKCFDCEPSENGKCLTASWQFAFQRALGKAVDNTLSKSKMNLEEQTMLQNSNTDSRLSKERDLKPKASLSKPVVLDDGKGGIGCLSCGKQTISLYMTAKKLLVCKSCFRQSTNS